MERDNQFNSQWYLFKDNQKLGPFNLRNVVIMYYAGEISGQELWQSVDGKVQRHTNWLLKNLRKF